MLDTNQLQGVAVLTVRAMLVAGVVLLLLLGLMMHRADRNRLES
jgi:hypothetical protein